MSDKPTPEFVLFVPGRAGRFRVAADRAYDDGDTLTLTSGGQQVAVSSPRGVAVSAAAMVSLELPELLPGARARARDLPPPPAMRIGEGVSISSLPVPFWPFLSGGALGFIGGFGLAISCAGLW
ncbi:hypothetical protein C6A77_19300 [Pseudomonas sp. AFG_SD02_1510_Pfu_092]|uniref:hypothetical protein n=1 Tax=Pseudomonas sp. AFG_SD02_1510_Pfu_092 TaxID=2259497 RepID=UPI000DEFCDBC|nr:hypothetical protein [Pseudomonas sp. AFG_SD02_1510_Pfu_092]RCL22986.1 hypothetical protein C6A77_19300 [Pseudomonas sp. AFG_SD02_1510_Pfu_092]